MAHASEGRFSDRADDYRRFRPDYPQAVIDEILAYFDFGSHRITAVDIGNGTGISSQLLASVGWPDIVKRAKASTSLLPRGMSEDQKMPHCK